MATELRDDLDERHRVDLGAAVLLGQPELEEPSLREKAHDLERQAPERLGFVGVRPQHRPERAGVVEQRHAAGSWGSPRTRSAMMLRCTSEVPPPIVSARANM